MKTITRMLAGATLLSMLTTAACTSSKPSDGQTDVQALDTVLVDWTPTSVPMPIIAIQQYDDQYNLISTSLRQVFASAEDSALYTSLAHTYGAYFNASGKVDIMYAGQQQEGKEMGMLIGGKYSYCMKGLNFDYMEHQGELNDGFAFNDEFLQSHEVLSLHYPGGQAPRSVVDSVEARYQNKVLSSFTCAVTPDRSIAIYSIQMKPQGDRCLGLRVISQNDQLSYYEEWSMDYNDMSAWHVDDGGEYYPLAPLSITRGAKGLDVFYFEGAPESATFSVLLQRGDSISDYNFAMYYCAVDYTPSPDPVDLPGTAELACEVDGYKVWINTDIEPSEDDPAGQYSVYYSQPDSKDVYRVVTSGMNPEAYKRWDDDAPYVEGSNVQSASEAFVVKDPNYDNYYLIVQGCPDARNIMSYIISLPMWSIEPYFRWIRTNEGFLGLEDGLLKFSHYRYHDEGGRYSVYQYYDFNWNMVKEEVAPED